MEQKNQWMTDDQKREKIIELNEIRFYQWKQMVFASQGADLDKIIKIEIDKITSRLSI